MALRYLDLLTDSALVDYQEAWDLQREVHAEVAAGTRPATVILLEHAPVYTAGKRTEPHERPLDETPVIDVDRGGKITWHGPGQLVGYPIVKLPEAVGVVDYVRRLEEALIRAFAAYGLDTGRVPGRSGVWLAPSPSTGRIETDGSGHITPARPERKIAAIGVRVAAGTTMHGFAANIDPDLASFGKIIPCGITDAGVTSLGAEIDGAPTLAGFAETLKPHLEELLSFRPYEKSPDLPERAAEPAITYGLAVTASH
jgi:lipoyl(octanoyl) transferase